MNTYTFLLILSVIGWVAGCSKEKNALRARTDISTGTVTAPEAPPQIPVTSPEVPALSEPLPAPLSTIPRPSPLPVEALATFGFVLPVPVLVPEGVQFPVTILTNAYLIRTPHPAGIKQSYVDSFHTCNVFGIECSEEFLAFYIVRQVLTSYEVNLPIVTDINIDQGCVEGRTVSTWNIRHCNSNECPILKTFHVCHSELYQIFPNDRMVTNVQLGTQPCGSGFTLRGFTRDRPGALVKYLCVAYFHR